MTAATRIHDPRYEQASAEEIRALQLRRLRHLLRWTWSSNEFYRGQWARAAVDVERIDSLEAFAAQIPTVQTADFIADQESDPPYGRRHAYARGLGAPLILMMTSGTSGQGQEIHLQTAAEMEITNGLYSFMFRWAGLLPGDALFLAMPITMLAGGRGEYHGAVTYGLTTHAVGNYDAARKVELLRRFTPQTILGNTSYLGRLATLLEGAPPPGLKCLISGGEGSGFEWLQRLERAWGVPVFDRYGTTQMGTDHVFTCDQGIGSAERPGMLHNLDHLFVTEVIDPDTGRQVRDGEEGEVVLTPLYRTDVPVVRCRVLDRAIYREARSCACGRPFGGIQIASIARADDMKKVKGVNVWPQAVDDVLFARPEVQEYQVQLATAANGGGDVATVRAMPRRPLSHPEQANLTATISDTLRQRIGIRFEVELLEPGALDQNEWKARRWIDTRAHVRGT